MYSIRMWRDRPSVPALPVPSPRYAEEISSAAMLPAERSAGVTPEVNLRKCVTCLPPPSANKAGFETQRRRQKQEYQWPQKDLYPQQI